MSIPQRVGQTDAKLQPYFDKINEEKIVVRMMRLKELTKEAIKGGQD
jgi:hypothetical protein